ncbi:unnamed protein product [Strongylus vulgaris]|uniref:Uncharacterized protein n=1 Tax=Strongylus vulgaris TaxID=40348 RepID=A0A3P7I6L7_STRVU|nr:unnamed protein product [Strongylus vulgaris]
MAAVTPARKQPNLKKSRLMHSDDPLSDDEDSNKIRSYIKPSE